MALKTRYTAQSDIPEALRSLYRQDGSQWVLDLEAGDDDGGGGGGDAELARKLAEFRTNNRKLAGESKTLQEQLAALQSKMAGLGDADPDQIQEALALFAKLKDHEDAQLIKQGRIDDVLAKRVGKFKGDYEKKIADLEKASNDARAEAEKNRDRAAQILLERHVRRVVAEKKLGLVPTAEQDLMARVRGEFRLEDLDGDPVPASDRYGSLDEFVTKLPELAPHYFQPAAGGGTPGGQRGGRVENGVRVLKRSEISSADYAAALTDPKVKVVME